MITLAKEVIIFESKEVNNDCSAGYGNLFFHMNWGWEGDHNGLYSFDDFTPGSSNYDHNNNEISLVTTRSIVIRLKNNPYSDSNLSCSRFNLFLKCLIIFKSTEVASRIEKLCNGTPFVFLIVNAYPQFRE